MYQSSLGYKCNQRPSHGDSRPTAGRDSDLAVAWRAGRLAWAVTVAAAPAPDTVTVTVTSHRDGDSDSEDSQAGSESLVTAAAAPGA